MNYISTGKNWHIMLYVWHRWKTGINNVIKKTDLYTFSIHYGISYSTNYREKT